MRKGALCLGIVTLLVAVPSLGRPAAFSALNIDFLGRGGSPQGLVARPGGPDNLFWNPSGLAYAASPSGLVFAGYMDYLVGMRGGTAGYLGSGGARLGYGSYISYLSSGSIPVTTWDDPIGGRGGTFTYGEFVAGVACGGEVRPHLSLGGALKLARETMENVTATGVFADLGGTLSLHRGQARDDGLKAYVSIVGRNIGLRTWETKDAKAPSNAEIGLAVAAPGGRASAGLAFYLGRHGQREARLGMSALLSDEFEVRLGWRKRVGIASDGAFDFPWQRGLIAGFGVSLGKFWIDYTYEDASPLDAIHRFGLRASLKPG
jgi:hypothetical protein